MPSCATVAVLFPTSTFKMTNREERKRGVVNVDSVTETLVMVYKILILRITVPASIKDEG